MLRSILALSTLATLAVPQELGHPEAGPFSGPSPWSSPKRVLLIGALAQRPIDVPGVKGDLGLVGAHVDSAGPAPVISARLFELRHATPASELTELHYQILEQDPSTRALGLSDVMRLPLGSDEEATVALRTTPVDPPMDANDIVYPNITSITMTLNREPSRASWVRLLTFTNYQGAEKVVPIAFTRSSGLTWRGRLGPAGLETLQSLATTGNRSHWDDMKLENRSGGTALDIAHFTLVLHYDKGGSDYEENIPVVDTVINRVLGAGSASIDLDAYATTSRMSFGGIHSSAHAIVKLVAADFGKSGSDGRDGFGSNPKYRGDDEQLCSEFVSWYYHEAGLVIDGHDFRDITSTSKLTPIFEDDGRRYDYNNGSRQWILAGGTERYTPQAGDLLARRKGSEYEHSMIVLGWNDATKVMTVVNGPWPVTVRYVPIQEVEEEGKNFEVGRIR